MGKLFSHCMNVIIPNNGSRHGRVMKLLVEVDQGKSLLRGIKLKLDEELIWVDFCYKQLPAFCFYCGIMGHQERSCEMKLRDSEENKITEDQYSE